MFYRKKIHEMKERDLIRQPSWFNSVTIGPEKLAPNFMPIHKSAGQMIESGWNRTQQMIHTKNGSINTFAKRKAHKKGSSVKSPSAVVSARQQFAWS